MSLKIYFAGSIRGGRVDAGLYRRMIRHMQEKHQVLTEHVGDLRESDVLIAECTCPSLGVGYELAYAEQLGKPCHIFYNPSKTQLSAMLTGDPYFHIIPYSEESELIEALDKILQNP